MLKIFLHYNVGINYRILLQKRHFRTKHARNNTKQYFTAESNKYDVDFTQLHIIQ